MERKNNKKKFVIISIILVLVVLGLFILFKELNSRFKSKTQDELKKEEYVNNNIDGNLITINLGVGEETSAEKIISLLTEENEEDYSEEMSDNEIKNYKIENLDTEGIIKVTDNTITGIYDGKAKVRIYNENENYEVEIVVTTETSNATVSSVKSAEIFAKIKMPVPGDGTDGKSGKEGKYTSTAQEFDIDNNYIYISVPRRGICKAKYANQCHNDLKTVRIFRFYKGKKEYDYTEAQIHTLLNSGHGTVFNVITNNGSQYMLTGITNSGQGKGLRRMANGKRLGTSHAIAMVSFNANNVEDLANRSSSNKYTPKNNSTGIDSIGLDEYNKKISITTKTSNLKQCIYNYHFQNDKLALGNPTSCYNIPSGAVQGTEYYNGQVYVLTNKTINVGKNYTKQYNVESKVNGIIQNQLPGYGIELEGIKIIDGKIYIGVRASKKRDVYFYIFNIIL